MTWTVEIPRELKSPNQWQGRHWRYKQAETKAWEMDVAVLMLVPEARKNLWAVLEALNTGPKEGRRVCEERRSVTVTRLVPSSRNFIRDDDNLRFSVKPLNDALKRLGLIKDDNRKWLEQPMPTQQVSPTKTWSTVITIASVGIVAGGRAPEQKGEELARRDTQATSVVQPPRRARGVIRADRQ